MDEMISFDADDTNNDIVVLGDEKASNQISFQLAQAFYNEMTGKSERLSGKFNDSYLIKLSDIEQLHFRLTQLTEQYNICSANVSYSVQYNDGASERFTSLERFRSHAPSKGLAVEEITATYNILVILPKLKRPQEYKVRVSFFSRVAKIEKMREELSALPFQVPLHQFESATTIKYSIDYVDVAVAKTFESAIVSWSGGIEKTTPRPWVRKLREKASFAPRIAKYSLTIIAMLAVLQASTKLIPDVGYVVREVALFILFSAAFIILSYKIGSFFGRKAESHLDNTYEKSYINLSQADVNLVSEAENNINGSIKKAILNIVVTIILGAAGSILANQF
ncbi:TPA: hypothetical protein ACN30N_002543 [Vibrio campbellii]|uniref:hypothetical protein n=2 Tax=Vibrio campbellii TaxID=680 RepID=UPI000CD37B00|nr:hypothetical protein [Vibrio campbellii]AUV88516.1 hypothetical protein C1N50_20410 [Vibrio campbellii]